MQTKGHVVRKGTLVLAALLLSGCASPFAGREPLFNQNRLAQVRREALADLQALGQVEIDGKVEGRMVRTGTAVLNTDFFDYAEVAHQVVPNSYLDLARLALHEFRYDECVRLCQEAIEQGKTYYAEGCWMMLKIKNLQRAHKLMYEAELGNGAVDRAAIHYRYYLLLFELNQSASYKELVGKLICIRLGSMKQRSDYRSKYHAASFAEGMAAVAAVGNAVMAAEAANQGDHSTAQRHAIAASASAAAVVAIEAYKYVLKKDLNLALDQLLEEADRAAQSAFAEPTEEEVLRVKRISQLYRSFQVRDAGAAVDTYSLADLDQLLGSGERATISRDAKGKVTIIGKLANMLDAGILLANVTGLRPESEALQDDAQLNKYLTSNLYKMAGVQISSSEIQLLRSLIKPNTDSITLRADSINGRRALIAFRKLEQKLDAYSDWREEI